MPADLRMQHSFRLCVQSRGTRAASAAVARGRQLRQRSLEPEQLLVIVLPAPDLSASEGLCERAGCRVGRAQLWTSVRTGTRRPAVLVVPLHTAAS